MVHWICRRLFRHTRRGLSILMALGLIMFNLGPSVQADAATLPTLQVTNAQLTHLGLYTLSVQGTALPEAHLTITTGNTFTGKLPVTVTSAVYQGTSTVGQDAETFDLPPGSTTTVTAPLGSISTVGNYSAMLTVSASGYTPDTQSLPLDVVAASDPGLSPSAWFAGGLPFTSAASIASPSTGGNNTELTAGGNVEIFGKYGTTAAPAYAGYTVTLPAAVSNPAVYLRYSGAVPNIGEVMLRSATVTSPTATVTGAVYQTANFNLASGSWFSNWQYAVLPLPKAIPAGTYHLFVIDGPGGGNGPGGIAGNLIVNFGFLSNLQDGGRWLPPTITNGIFSGSARVVKPILTLTNAQLTHLGLYTLSAQGTALPEAHLTITTGNTFTGKLPVTVTSAVYQGTSTVGQDAETFDLPPGSTTTVTVPLGSISTVGNYSATLTVSASGYTPDIQSLPLDVVAASDPGLSPSAWFAGGLPFTSAASTASPSTGGNNTELTAGGNVEIYGKYGTTAAPAYAGYTVTLPAAVSNPAVYLRYSGAVPNIGEVMLRSATVTSPTATVTGAVYQTANFNLASGSWFSNWQYAVLPLPKAIPAGTYHLFVIDGPGGGNGPGGIAGNLIVNFGFLSNLQDGGRWLPPTITNGIFSGSARVKPILTIHAMQWTSPTGMYEWTGSPITPGIDLTMHNNGNVAINPVVTVSLSAGAHGSTVIWSNAKQPASESIPANSIDTMTVPLTALNQPNYYQATVQVSLNGQTVQSANMGLGIIYPPHSGLQPNSPFGMNARGINSGGNPQLLHELVQQIGVKWVRNAIPDGSQLVNPAPGQYWTPTQIQAAIDAVLAWEKHGVMVSGLVNYAPFWNTQGYPNFYLNRPASMAAQVQTVLHMIGPLSKYITDWEIWNEPWPHGYTWETGTGADYRRMAKMIYQAVKAKYPNVMLIGGGSVPYQRDVLYAGASHVGYVDGSVDHPYTTPTRQLVGLTETQRYLDKKYSVSHGAAGIWNTEFATSTGNYPTLSPTEQQVRIAQSVAPEYLMQMLGAGHTPVHLYWFSLGDSSYSGDSFNIFNESTNSPQPSMIAYAAMTHFVGSSTLFGDAAPHARSIWPLVFTQPNGHATAVLFTDNRTGTVTIRNAQGLQFYNYLGKPLPGASNTGGSVTLSLKPWQSVYVQSSVTAQALSAQLNAAQWNIERGVLVYPLSLGQEPGKHPLTVSIEVQNAISQPIVGSLALTAPNGWRVAATAQPVAPLLPGQKRTLHFTVTQSQANALNRYSLSWALQYHELTTPASATPGTLGGNRQTITESGVQNVQVAVAPYAQINVNAPLSQWADIPQVTMVNPASTQYTELETNPLAMKQALTNPTATTPVYSLRTAWNHSDFFVEAQIPTSNPSGNNGLIFGFRNLAHNPSDVVPYFAGYRKAGLKGSVDYEFEAQAAGGKPQLLRVVAPGTNLQDYYPSSAPTDPSLGAMPINTTGHSQVSISYDATDGVETFQIAIPWRDISTLGAAVNSLHGPGSLMTHFAWAAVVNGNNILWTQEAGMFRSGMYGFPPFWNYSSTITTPWSFVNSSTQTTTTAAHK